MGIIESYSRATQSSNLRDDEHHHATEKLAAVALSSDLGAALFRVKFGNDATTYKALLTAWQAKVTVKAGLRKNWPDHIKPNKLAAKSLNYWLNDICEACSGKGYEVATGTPKLSNDLCKLCNGEKKAPLVCEPDWREYILDMIEDLDDLVRYSAGRAMRKLAKDMER
ncbi:MAG: hypothetical protein JWR22_1309 [Herminiimonas sp.]|nr:hypothetical protein [Herminiimonas sp.]